jgi:hypothetical protein
MEGRNVVWPTTRLKEFRCGMKKPLKDCRIQESLKKTVRKKIPGFCKVMPVPIEISKPAKDHNQQNSIFPLQEK